MAQMLERYVYKNQKKMRCGYTTGTCAAAAAKAAAQMLLSGRKVTEVSVRTPSDITLTLPVCEIQRQAHTVSCAVQKDSGDDPDITNKILIFAEVSYIHNNSNTRCWARKVQRPSPHPEIIPVSTAIFWSACRSV